MDIDLVVKNARVITMDAGRPFAQAVAVRAGRIAAVGGAETAARGCVASLSTPLPIRSSARVQKRA